MSSGYKKQKIISIIFSKKPTYKITLQNWITHQVTPDHRLPTQHNFHPTTSTQTQTPIFDSNKLTNTENYSTAEQLYNNYQNYTKILNALKQERRDTKINSWASRQQRERIEKEIPFLPIAFNYHDKIINQTNQIYSPEEILLYGYFLGDWCRKSNWISWNHDRLLDPKIINPDNFHITKSKDRNCFRYNVPKFKQKVNLQWCDLYSYEKFIDPSLFTYPKQHIYKLIEWLFNTDAYISKKNNLTAHIEFCSTSQQLIQQLQLLLSQIWIISQIRKKKIKSNFQNHREFAYLLDITDSKSLKTIINNIDISTKLNYQILIDFLQNINSTDQNWKHSLIPLIARNEITNSQCNKIKIRKLPSYNFQREKIEWENPYFTWPNLKQWLDYNWVKIESIEFIPEPQDVVTITVDSDDELYFSNWVLTHNSLTIAEKAVELSFIPNNDSLVWAFISKTTNVIRNYMLKLILPFPPDTFQHYKSEWYILNTQSGTKIYFRTLSDHAQNVLWLTLYNIIIDEAQLVDDDIFEDALLPTLTTTWGKLILIWTPWMKQKWYFFNKMIEAKKQKEDPILSPYEIISLYEIDITQNPLVHPKTREKIMAKQHDPSIQRQYFCSWKSGWDNLFQPHLTNQSPFHNKTTLNPNAYLVIWLDPARLQDRSAYSINYVFNNKITTISSWEVPKSHKIKWELQAIFYKKMLEKLETQIPKSRIVTVMDVTWVWDWVVEIFRNNNVNINVWIRYTSWAEPNTKDLIWKVPKSTLIINTLDLISEEIYEVYEPANQDLLEEMDYIYETSLRNWQIAMKSTFQDDIVNSTLTALYLISVRKLLSRTNLNWESNQNLKANTVEARMAGIEDPNRKIQQQQQLKQINTDIW